MTNQHLLKRLQELATEHAEISATARSAILQQQEEIDRLLAALREIGSLATPEKPDDDERQFARMREIVRGALPQTGEQTPAGAQQHK